MTAGRISLITGGVRSGKSARAQAVALAEGRAVAFVATAQAYDDEFRWRIARHRRDRPAGWATIEEPTQLKAALAIAWGVAPVVIVDDLAVWLSNRLLAGAGVPDNPDWPNQLDQLDEALAGEAVEALRATPPGGRLILVTQETGWGVVPPYPLGRAFRDSLGRLNQIVAAEATDVTLMVAGLPVAIKGAPATL